MPKNIVAPPAAVVAVDRLTLQADDAGGDLCSECISVLFAGGCMTGCACGLTCFSEE